LQEKTDSFKQWAEKLTQYAGEKGFLNEMEYWAAVEETLLEKLPKDFEIGKEEKTYRNSSSVTVCLEEEETRLLLNEVNLAYNTEINDILLAALGMAVRDWAGIKKVVVNLEGHGREAIFEELEISRTVGWYTTLFPVVLNMSGAKGLSYRLKEIKGGLRKVPGKGIGYGVLKFLTSQSKKGGMAFKLEPEIAFNYLGELGRENAADSGPFRLSQLSTGTTVSPDMETIHAIYVSGMVNRGKFSLTVTYNNHEYKKSTVEQLADIYRSNLMKIIAHCTGKEEVELTPDDMDYSEYNIDELDELEKEMNQID